MDTFETPETSETPEHGFSAVRLRRPSYMTVVAYHGHAGPAAHVRTRKATYGAPPVQLLISVNPNDAADVSAAEQLLAALRRQAPNASDVLASDRPDLTLKPESSRQTPIAAQGGTVADRVLAF